MATAERRPAYVDGRACPRPDRRAILNRWLVAPSRHATRKLSLITPPYLILRLPRHAVHFNEPRDSGI